MKPFTIGKNEANKSHEDQTSQNEMNILLRCISTLDPITIGETSHRSHVLDIIVLIATKLTLTR